MCGIVGGITSRPINHILIEGLKRLEYRGYDSAGVTVLNSNNALDQFRALGKVRELEAIVEQESTECHLGIAHTRWATHGAPAENNAHPHHSHDSLALVHNGIIENHNELRTKLIQLGYSFDSETDSEVIVHLLHHYCASQATLEKALYLTCQELEGAYAIGVIDTRAPDTLYAARHGSPLVIGCGFEENYIASDPLALLPVTQTFMYLKDGDVATIRRNEITIKDHLFNECQREIKQTSLQISQIDRGEFRHFMMKEINEQSTAVVETLESAISQNDIQVQAFGHQAEALFPEVKRVHIVACGTSLHAAAVAEHWIEEHAKLPCQIEIASEHRYRSRTIEPGTLLVALSQSGETADTLAALRQAKNNGYIATLGICNVPESSLVREADLIFLTRAGIEIGVAATKTFTAQLVALACLTLALNKSHGFSEDTRQPLIQSLEKCAREINDILNMNEKIESLASLFQEKQHALFLGRGPYAAIAMEGALKLKEISYIHAESYAAGELKHGPLALIDEHMPTIVCAPSHHLIDKVISNIKEVQARGGELIILSDQAIDEHHNDNITLVPMPKTDPFTAPILYNIPLQLLAYHVAVQRGTDVDQPRNLAKSVTVE